MLPLFADTGIHISLKAETLFTVGPLAVTNSMVYGLLCAIILAAGMLYAAHRVALKPQKGLAGAIELLVNYVLKLLEGLFGTPEQAAKFTPIFAGFFLFILVSNLSDLLPVVGPSIHSGGTPLFRPFTADFNGTIALSIIAIIMVQVLSIREQGFKKHMQHYFSTKPQNPINFFIGLLEVLEEFTRALSLSLRLFLNVAVGEILITVFTSLILSAGRTPLAVVPILLFEGLVAYIQAYVFTVLAASYLGMAISHADEPHAELNQPVPTNKVEAGAGHG